jgi:hypothetical protein
MILPTKHIRADRALLGIGAEILDALKRPMTVSGLWDDVRGKRTLYAPKAPIDYEWFVLALDLLYLMGSLDFDRGVVRRANQ